MHIIHGYMCIGVCGARGGLVLKKREREYYTDACHIEPLIWLLLALIHKVNVRVPT